MINKNDWEQTKQKYVEYWNKENHDRPLICVTAPKDGHVRKNVKAPENLVDRWTDIEYVIENTRANFEATYFGAEAYPNVFPNLGPDIFGAILGCDLEFGEHTSWAKHFVNDWKEIGKLEFNPENKWWKKIKEMSEALVEDAKQGDYIVGVTDLHPGMDALVSMRGPENVCMDLIDSPDEIKKATEESFEVYEKVLGELFSITTKYQQGTTHWLSVWHPGKWYSTSCDFICMISQEMFDEFILPEIKRELRLLDGSIFHLDGPEALKHLDALLELPNLNGIQWVYGAGKPTASHWIPVLKKIQGAGKIIHVDIVPEEIDVLLEELKPEGLLLNTRCNTEQDAKDLIRKAEKSYKRKLY